MYWVLQHNYKWDDGSRELLDILKRCNIPHSVHKVIPFVGEIEPDISPDGKVIVMGAYSLKRVAKRKGWIPGSFDLGDITFQDHRENWGMEMLNHDAIITTFGKSLNEDLPHTFFSRPVIDSKIFAGTIFEKDEFLEWRTKIVALGADHQHVDLTLDTEIMISPPKNIINEYRCWIVDRKVVTASLYKRSGRVVYSDMVDQYILDYAQRIADIWSPLDCYVLDVALMEDGLKVIETNTLNAAGFYAANMSKLVQALEEYAEKV
jgi:hypothetical protein